jgi:hypothetical protein
MTIDRNQYVALIVLYCGMVVRAYFCLMCGRYADHGDRQVGVAQTFRRAAVRLSFADFAARVC